jgi:nucleoside-diphosphate-sugar epimerase
MNKKVLVCGGSGYIGGLTCDYLIREGFDVTVYDNLLYENRFLKEIPFIYGDIRDTKLLSEVSKVIDVIVLMSALVGDPACSVDQKLTEEINYKAIKDFCEVVSPNKHLIFMSTCSVYGAQDGLLNEESTTNPLSSYASTKLAAEKLHAVYGQMKKEIGQVIVGQDSVIEQVLMAVFCRGHALLVGVLGLANTPPISPPSNLRHLHG